MTCSSATCGHTYPIVDGIPIMLNEANSVFMTADFVSNRDTYFARSSRITRMLTRLLPSLGGSLNAAQRYKRFLEHISLRKDPFVLVLGGSVVGEGIRAVLDDPRLSVIETDVAFGPRTKLVSDAHDIPFGDETFDAVIAQAVLEHVVDPFRCVEEIHRVLKPEGIVFAEIPFMQQVHGGRYDFTRFTQLGNRRLFRRFEELEMSVCGGPGMALAWSFQYFLLSFVRRRKTRLLIKACVRLTLFWLKYWDRYLYRKGGSYDAASGLHFLGQKSNHILADRDLIQLYRGTNDVL